MLNYIMSKYLVCDNKNMRSRTDTQCSSAMNGFQNDSFASLELMCNTWDADDD